MLVLLVGDQDVGSTFWLNILPFAQSAAMRYYITERDMRMLAPHAHVLPDVVPAFLVCVDGFFVDWFPAPMPALGRPPSPLALLRAAEEALTIYAARAPPAAA